MIDERRRMRARASLEESDAFVAQVKMVGRLFARIHCCERGARRFGFYGKLLAMCMALLFPGLNALSSFLSRATSLILLLVSR